MADAGVQYFKVNLDVPMPVAAGNVAAATEGVTDRAAAGKCLMGLKRWVTDRLP